jgi:DNA-directed RNA polymerase sigma subunit (sigma70/sigma32)
MGIKRIGNPNYEKGVDRNGHVTYHRTATGPTPSKPNLQQMAQDEQPQQRSLNLGQPPSGVEARTEFRRQATIQAVRGSKSLSPEERSLLEMRFGINTNGGPKTLREIADKAKKPLIDVRRFEVGAMRKLYVEYPELDTMTTAKWLGL